ncbi:hypothetical protein A3768_4558 (plasmid) [Ralstonia solanacearum]|nr:hypothetical protein F504_4946 [Ralstonia pseudosolanacearum FQY_4]ANH35368.1 hypothetical protein A3768_4558 [Ralstonia solanacearum]
MLFHVVCLSLGAPRSGRWTRIRVGLGCRLCGHGRGIRDTLHHLAAARIRGSGARTAWRPSRATCRHSTGAATGNPSTIRSLWPAVPGWRRDRRGCGRVCAAGTPMRRACEMRCRGGVTASRSTDARLRIRLADFEVRPVGGARGDYKAALSHPPRSIWFSLSGASTLPSPATIRPPPTVSLPRCLHRLRVRARRAEAPRRCWRGWSASRAAGAPERRRTATRAGGLCHAGFVRRGT